MCILYNIQNVFIAIVFMQIFQCNLMLFEIASVSTKHTGNDDKLICDVYIL